MTDYFSNLVTILICLEITNMPKRRFEFFCLKELLILQFN